MVARLLRRWQGARGRLGLVREVIRVGQRHCRLVMAAVLTPCLAVINAAFEQARADHHKLFVVNEYYQLAMQWL